MSKRTNRIDLAELAAQVLLERGLEPEFTPEALNQVARLQEPAKPKPEETVRDLRSLLWASIDNDNSRDLDQLTVADDLGKGATRVLVAIADVDAMVKQNSPVDVHARKNTTSIYTAARVFPMLPERLSTDLSSLNPDQERLAVVIAYTVDSEGVTSDPEIYRALVHSKAKLAYNSVGAWLNGEEPMPAAMQAVEGLADQMRLQDAAAQRLCIQRHRHGALVLDSIETRAIMEDGEVLDIERESKNRAHEIIEDFMIAANGVVARFLDHHGSPSFRRVVRSPERWDRIESLAADYGEELPPDPDPVALQRFLLKMRKADPVRFPDLSLTIIKLLGRGEYAVHEPNQDADGHFGLAVRDYSHSTAPNRRYPDVITQRLLKAVLGGRTIAYGPVELAELAQHCTAQEDAAKKAERQIAKSAAAMLLAHRIGQTFDGIITGAKPKGVWARIFHPPVEGRVVEGEAGLDVGDRVRVRLVDTDVHRGYIDFAIQ
ncbi:MAG: RNB domain-containing ribonuclease [Chthonomonadales bacterium]|nr:RNB domain-containing ribonuclease [Chthonomonadales bacterium]